MPNDRKKVVLVTASHLSSCPRLLKEAELLNKHGYELHIVYLNSIYSIELLDRIIVEKNKNWNFYPIYWYGEKSNFLQKWISKFKYKFFQILNINSDYIQSTSDALIKATLKIKADVYIAHHPSVLVAVAKAAKKYNAKYIYDVEDAFPYITSLDYKQPAKEVYYVEKKYLHNASFLSFASPLYKDLYVNTYSIQNLMIDLLNVFNINTFNTDEYFDRKDKNKISFYWQSQTVGLNRGLQDIIIALSNFDSSQWELHIRGTHNADIKKQLLGLSPNKELTNNIFFHSLVPAGDLQKYAKEHDIGLALEPIISINRDLCISNKILEYLVSGLMVIATNTKGHQFIMDKLGASEFTYTSNHPKELIVVLEKIFTNPSIIQDYKEKSYMLAEKELNWDIQSRAWLLQIKELLK